MNKIIYKQSNKIGLALLVLGGVVSNVGTSSTSSSSSVHSQECVTGGDNAQLGITLNPSQIRASDISDNSLPGSSGDIPIGRPTPVTDITYASNASKIRFVYKTTGNYITSTPKTTLSEARKSIREALGMSVCIDLMHNDKKITDEEQFADVKGDIQCVIVPLSTKAKRDAEEIYEKLKTVSRFEVSTELTQFLETKRQEYWYDKKEDLSYILPNEYVNNFLRVYVDLICDGASSLEILIEAMENWKEKHESYQAIVAVDVLTRFKSIVKTTCLIPEHIQRKLDTLMTFLDNNRDAVQDRWSAVCNILDKELMGDFNKFQSFKVINDTLQKWKEKNSMIPEESANNDAFLASFADMIKQSTTNDGKTVEEKVKEFKTFLTNNIVTIKDTLGECEEKLRSEGRLLCNECVGAWSVYQNVLWRLTKLCKQNVKPISSTVQSYI